MCVLCLLCFYFLLSPSSFLLHFFCCFRPISLAIKYTYMYVFFSFNIFLRSFALFLTTFQLDLLGTFIILLFHNSDVRLYTSFTCHFSYILICFMLFFSSSASFLSFCEVERISAIIFFFWTTSTRVSVNLSL